MNQFGALWYRDRRRLVNSLAMIRRSPARLFMWIVVVLWLAFQTWNRANLARQGAFHFPDLQDPIASAIAGLAIALGGFALGRASGNSRLTAFGDPVDAYFLVRSSLDERIVLFWMQLRQIFLSLFGVFLASIFVAAYFSHGNAAGAALGLAGVLILVQALLPPTALIARRTVVLSRLWYAVAGIGTVVLLLSFLRPSAAASFGLGRVLIALWHGNAPALAALYGCVALAFAAGVVYAHDIYPELYATARLLASARERVRRGDFLASAMSAKTTHSSTTALRGPWVEIWKQLVLLRRGNGALATTVGAGIAVALGLAAGIGERHSEGVGFAIGFTVLSIVLALQTTRSISLATDVAKPLWWMGDGSTFTKLAVWTFASALPAIAFVALAATLMLAISAPASIAVFVPIAAILVLVSRAIGVFGYALTPALTDQRGPGVMIRLMLFYAGLLFAAFSGVVAGVLTRNFSVGFITATIVLIGEGVGGIALASVRLSGRGLEIALAETT